MRQFSDEILATNMSTLLHGRMQGFSDEILSCAGDFKLSVSEALQQGIRQSRQSIRLLFV